MRISIKINERYKVVIKSHGAGKLLVAAYEKRRKVLEEVINEKDLAMWLDGIRHW